MPLFDLSFLKSDSHSVRLIKSVFWNLAGNSFSKILLMLATIFVAKLLGPEDFGKWSIVQSTTMIFSLLMGFGIGVPATKYLAEFRLSDKHKAGRFLSISLFFFCLYRTILNVSIDP